MRLSSLSPWLALLSLTFLHFQKGCRGVDDDGNEDGKPLPYAWTRNCQELAFKLECFFSLQPDMTTCTEACDELYRNAKRRLGQGVVAERRMFFEYSKPALSLVVAGIQPFTFFFEPCLVQTFLCLRQSASDDLSEGRQEGQPNCLAHASTSKVKQTCGPNPVGRTCRCEMILILRKLLMRFVDHEEIGQFGCSAEDICFRSRLLLGSNWNCHSKALLRKKIRCRVATLEDARQDFAMCACNKKHPDEYQIACQDLSQIEFVPFSPPASPDPSVRESIELYKRYLHQWTLPALRDQLLPENLRLNIAGLDRIPRMNLILRKQRIVKIEDYTKRLLVRQCAGSRSSRQSALSPVASTATQPRGERASKRNPEVAALDPLRSPSPRASIRKINAGDAASRSASAVIQEGVTLDSHADAAAGLLQTHPIHLEETGQIQLQMHSYEETSNQQAYACGGFADAGPVPSLASAHTRPAFDLDTLFNSDPRLHLASTPVDRFDAFQSNPSMASLPQEDTIALASLTTSSAEQSNLRSPFEIEDQDGIFGDLDPLPNVNLGTLESVHQTSISGMPQAAATEDLGTSTTDFCPWDFL